MLVYEKCEKKKDKKYQRLNKIQLLVFKALSPDQMSAKRSPARERTLTFIVTNQHTPINRIPAARIPIPVPMRPEASFGHSAFFRG